MQELIISWLQCIHQTAQVNVIEGEGKKVFLCVVQLQKPHQSGIASISLITVTATTFSEHRKCQARKSHS